MPAESSVYRVLVVDDNPSIHEDFRKILCPLRSTPRPGLLNLEQALFDRSADPTNHTAFRVDSAYQGQEALALALAAAGEGMNYSVAFVDVRMPPGWDGIETIHRIWREQPDIQMVICTAHSDYSWDEIRRRLGQTDSLVILRKPFDNIEVLQLAHALSKKWVVSRQAKTRLNDLDERVRARTAALEEANTKLRHEIARRAESETSLRESEERFRAAFATSAVAIAILRDSDLRFTHVNPSFAHLVGRPETELVGKEAARLGLWADPQEFDQLRQRSRQGQIVRNAELKIERPDGECRIALAAFELVTEARDRSLFASLVDITELRHLEEQLRQSQKMEAIGQLAAGVAHDFNNLLTVICGHMSMQLSRTDLDSDVLNSLRETQMAAERAATLTRQLLAFSRKQIVLRKKLDLNQLLRRLQPLLPRLIGETIHVEFGLAANLSAVSADESNLEQVIINFVVNARDAMPEGGLIRITTGEAEVDVRQARGHHDRQPGKFVVLTVTDNGCGMEEAVMRRVFEPFFTTKEVGKGTGLGLSTAYGIVKQHEGWIEVESQVGMGSSFRVYLPAVPATPETPASQRGECTGRPSARGEATILVVEDEEAVRTLIVRTLLRQGYEVLEASNGSEAWALWQDARHHRRPVGLLLADVVLPSGISGTQLATQLRQDRANLPIVFTSGYSQELSYRMIGRTDGVRFLAKPFDQDELLSVVRQAIEPQPAE